MFVTQLALDYALLEVDPGAHLVAEVIRSSRLNNVAQLETFSNVAPLLVLLRHTLHLNRCASVHLHQLSLIDG